MEVAITNAKLILESEVVDGTVVFDERGIRSVSSGRISHPGAIDAEGDFVSPGLIEMHTDNLERHFVPRPGVVWPNGLAAALAHDAQMAAAGVTTVYDAVCAGYDNGETQSARRDIFESVLTAVSTGVRQAVFRIDHKLHLRCELTGIDVVDVVSAHIDNPLVALGSLMDHTPGQRQWTDLAKMKTYVLGKTGRSESGWQAHLETRLSSARHVPRNWDAIVGMFAARAVPLATHDDTTIAHVEASVASGAVISEFPTTAEAATAAKSHGLATVAGAPNVVRGGSHSGGVSVRALAEKGVLDGLSSDYVPSSLLQAARILHDTCDVPLASAVGMVTWRIADMLGLRDRGRLREGLRADVLRFRFVEGTPVVRGVWAEGQLVH
jgi:alpha-D-ribose 1-methylphosphonate 5-triphosphate diphosphatase